MVFLGVPWAKKYNNISKNNVSYDVYEIVFSKVLLERVKLPDMLSVFFSIVSHF